jgi:hypothetical protein
MTLGNMGENRVRRLDVSCWICHHAAVLDVDGVSFTIATIVQGYGFLDF